MMPTAQQVHSPIIRLSWLLILTLTVSASLSCGKGTYDSRMQTRIEQLRTTATTDPSEADGEDSGESNDNGVDDEQDTKAQGEEDQDEDLGEEPSGVFAEEDE